MPLRIYVSGERMDITPSTKFSSVKLKTEKAEVAVDNNYYVAVLKMTEK